MNDVTRDSKQWVRYERGGSIEVRPYDIGDELHPNISVCDADISRASLSGGVIVRNSDNHEDMWYIAPDCFANHYRTAEAPAESPAEHWMRVASLVRRVWAPLEYDEGEEQWRVDSHRGTYYGKTLQDALEDFWESEVRSHNVDEKPLEVMPPSVSPVDSLRNCLLLAMKRLHKGSIEPIDWEHIIRFCREAGVNPSTLRGAKKERPSDCCFAAGCKNPHIACSVLCEEHYNAIPSLRRGELVKPTPVDTKVAARNVHYRLIEDFGLTNTPMANSIVRGLLEGLTRASKPPSDDRREDRAYYNGARQAAAMACDPEALDAWIFGGCGGRGPVTKDPSNPHSKSQEKSLAAMRTDETEMTRFGTRKDRVVLGHDPSDI